MSHLVCSISRASGFFFVVVVLNLCMFQKKKKKKAYSLTGCEKKNVAKEKTRWMLSFWTLQKPLIRYLIKGFCKSSAFMESAEWA